MILFSILACYEININWNNKILEMTFKLLKFKDSDERTFGQN